MSQETKRPIINANELPPFVQAWKEAINSGKSPRQIAEECYHPDALLKGTVSGKTVKGHDAITSYFEHFLRGKTGQDAEFNTRETSPRGSVSGQYTFLWEDEDGNAQEGPANYTFEPAKTDDGREVIGLHHSSFQPD